MTPKETEKGKTLPQYRIPEPPSILSHGYFSTPTGMMVLAAMVVGAILVAIFEGLTWYQWYFTLQDFTLDHTPQNLLANTKHKRSVISGVGNLGRGIDNDSMIAVTKDKDGIVTFWYNSSSVQVATYTFELCDIFECSQFSEDKECEFYGQIPKSRDIYICVTDDYWGDNCRHWGAVGWNIGPDWAYKPESARKRTDENGKSLLTRLTLTKTGTCPKYLKGSHTTYGGVPRKRMKFTLNIENPRKTDEGTYLLGMWPTNYRLARFRLKDMNKAIEWSQVVQHLEEQTNELLPDVKMPRVFSVANPTYADVISIETGYSETNLWLEWMRYTALQHNMTDCYVCAGARPHLGTVPLNLPQESEKCFLSLYTNTSTDSAACTYWKKTYPLQPSAVHSKLASSVTVYKDNYTCYNNRGGEGVDLGTFPSGYCGSYSTVDIALLQNQTQTIGDIYWLCGDLKLRAKLPVQWKGECALTKILMPLHMFKEADTAPSSTKSRIRRDIKGSLDPHVYIDAIGVPRGVPDEFKARDQVAAGFESLIPIITINKNIDWINYIYYNQQRFVNYTRDAVQGLAHELGPNSKMTFQNRMTLDMIMAEKGGVCKFLGLGDTCCTYIPNNTGPNGKVTVALAKLESLSEELKQNSGIDNPLTKWFENLFGSWGEFFKDIGMTILVILIIFSLLACCVIPLTKNT